MKQRWLYFGGAILVSIMVALAVPTRTFAQSTATGVSLSAYSDCSSPAGLNLSMNTDGTVTREGGTVTTASGATLMSFDQGSGFANFSGTFNGYNFSSPAWSVPSGTIVGLYAYIGSLPYNSSTTIEFFVAYVCNTGAVVTSCSGPFGTCPNSAAQIVGGGACGINDGRLNNSTTLDCAAPIAVYQSSDGLNIFAVNPSTSVGTLALSVPAGSFGASVASNTLVAEGVASGQPLQVYALAGGGFQIHTAYADGKPYIIAYSPATGLVHIAA